MGRGGVAGDRGEVGDAPVWCGERAGDVSVAGGDGPDCRSMSGGRPVGEGERLWLNLGLFNWAGAITLTSSSDPTLRALIAALNTLGTAASSS